MVVSLNESALLVHQENVLLATSETCFQFFPWNQFLTQCSLASQVNTITEKKKLVEQNCCAGLNFSIAP